ncbi:hypothetical protein GGR44_001939 [Sphingobium fontiphilum]|uniref:Uncharacterized protein n=1 Tax=Sphingobium fontiphilum TaxID=944425 RepID=A0A7W6GNG0_9SPHN|nr:hypothetical protein [Sphingobium fontiphilum]MBB3982276.1 hypothetical protein [Sphingobium fontiphilum]
MAKAFAGNGVEIVLADIANHFQTPDRPIAIPSLETCQVADGPLTIRYFQQMTD